MLNNITFHLEHVPPYAVAHDAESLASEEDFAVGVKSLIEVVHHYVHHPDYEDITDYDGTYYYTNEGDSYRFYAESDLSSEWEGV